MYAVVASTTVFRKYGDQDKIKTSDRGDTFTFKAIEEVTDRFASLVRAHRRRWRVSHTACYDPSVPWSPQRSSAHADSLHSTHRLGAASPPVLGQSAVAVRVTYTPIRHSPYMYTPPAWYCKPRPVCSTLPTDRHASSPSSCHRRRHRQHRGQQWRRAPRRAASGRRRPPRQQAR